jgi:hypothetical protein
VRSSGAGLSIPVVHSPQWQEQMLQVEVKFFSCANELKVDKYDKMQIYEILLILAGKMTIISNKMMVFLVIVLGGK